MHYYKRHLGDYAKKAGHLSMLEHGAFTLILDYYYDREQAPTKAEAIRYARARTPEEIAAVESVLDQFFELVGDRHHQNRCDEELSAYVAIVETNRRVALTRETTKRARSVHEPSTKRARKAHALSTERSPNQEPLTKNQEPELKDSEPNGSGAQNAPDPIFGFGLDMLTRKAVKELTARSFLGMMRKKVGDDVAFTLLERCDREDITDPIPWLQKAMLQRTGPPANGMTRAVNKDFKAGVNADGTF